MLNRGYVLILMLIMMQVLALSALTVIKSNTYQAQIVRAKQLHAEMLRQAKTILQQLEQDIRPACTQPRTLNILQRDANWWQTVACHGLHDRAAYAYFYEDFGLVACARLQAGSTIAHYYRVNLWLKSSHSDDEGLLLQSSVVQGVQPQNERCLDQAYFVMPGRQMLRELTRRITFE